MNDFTSNSSSVAPPSSSPAPSSAPDSSPAPSTPIEQTSQEALDQLASPDDATQYAEQRLADEGKIEREASEPKRRMTRYERLRKARDAAQAEAAALREQSTGPRSPDGTPEDVREMLHPEEYAAEQPDANGQTPPEGYEQTPEEREAYLHHVREQMTRDADIRADYRARERQVAAALPDYHDTIRAAADVDIGDTAAQLLRQSPHGPFIAYGLAKTVDGLEILHALKDANPLDVAKFVARAEAMIEHGNQQRAMRRQPQQQGQPQRRNTRVTNAPKPIAPLRGSGGPTPNLSGLASSENIDAYARQRLAQMRAKSDR
jgi:hypothetical protein